MSRTFVSGTKPSSRRLVCAAALLCTLGTLFLACETRLEDRVDSPAVLFASPDGSSDADGTFEHPYTLAQALDSVTSTTETIMLRPGVYRGPHNYVHDFERDDKLVIRPDSENGTRIDGAFYRSGGGIRWQDIEFSVSDWTTRKSAEGGSSPDEMPDFNFSVLAKDEFVNCIIRDHSNNGFWKPAENLLVYGCLIYNQGWSAPDRGHGHAAYVQNEVGTKRFIRNVLVKGFSPQTVQVYGSSNASLEGIEFEENVSIGGRWLVGGGAPVARLTMNGNHIQSTTQLGYGPSVVNRDARLVGNILAGEVARVGTWRDFNETETIYSTALDSVFVYDNAYDKDRGLIVIYNGSGKDRVKVDLSSLPLTSGKSYRLVNSMNPTETTSFVYEGNAVPVPMTGWTVSTPVAADSAVVGSRFPVFGAFLLTADPSSEDGFTMANLKRLLSKH